MRRLLALVLCGFLLLAGCRHHVVSRDMQHIDEGRSSGSNSDASWLILSEPRADEEEP